MQSIAEIAVGVRPAAVKIGPRVRWNHRRLCQITVAFVSWQRGWPFVNDCWGELRDGTACFVTLPFTRLPRQDWRGYINWCARRDGVWAKQLGLFRALRETGELR